MLVALVPACASDDDGATTTAPDATEQASADDGTTTTPDAAAESDATIDPTRELRIATTSPPPTTWDPAMFNGSVTQLPKFYNAVYDTLLRLDHNDELQPLLATSWEYDSTNTVLTLTLRDDVTFTDGAPFDAAAAKLNLDRVRTSSSSPRAAPRGDRLDRGTEPDAAGDHPGGADREDHLGLGLGRGLDGQPAGDRAWP